MYDTVNILQINKDDDLDADLQHGYSKSDI